MAKIKLMNKEKISDYIMDIDPKFDLELNVFADIIGKDQFGKMLINYTYKINNVLVAKMINIENEHGHYDKFVSSADDGIIGSKLEGTMSHGLRVALASYLKTYKNYHYEGIYGLL